MTIKKRFLVTPLALWSLLQLSGCSLIGFGLGSLRDATLPDEYLFTPSGVDSIKRGATIVITKTDSSVISGDFDRVAPLSSPEYYAKYRQAMQSLPNERLIPAPNDTIIVVTHDAYVRKVATGHLLGYDKGLVHVHISGRTSPTAVRVDVVDTLWKSDATFVDGDVLRCHLNNGDIPFMSAIAITNNNETQLIYIDDILKVRQPVTRNAKIWGLAIGAAVDITNLATTGLKFGSSR